MVLKLLAYWRLVLHSCTDIFLPCTTQSINVFHLCKRSCPRKRKNKISALKFHKEKFIKINKARASAYFCQSIFDWKTCLGQRLERCHVVVVVTAAEARWSRCEHGRHSLPLTTHCLFKMGWWVGSQTAGHIYLCSAITMELTTTVYYIDCCMHLICFLLDDYGVCI